jgi:hypothetical protein
VKRAVRGARRRPRRITGGQHVTLAALSDAIHVIAVLALAWSAGGYVADRPTRFDEARNRLLSPGSSVYS